MTPSRCEWSRAESLFDSPQQSGRGADYKGSPDGAPMQEVSPPVAGQAASVSDGGRQNSAALVEEYDSDDAVFITLPPESPCVSPHRSSHHRARRGRRSLVPETQCVTRRECDNNGFSTPVRSAEAARVEQLLCDTVRCPSPLRRRAYHNGENRPFEITPWISCGTAQYAGCVEGVARDGFTHVINMCPSQNFITREAYQRHGIELHLIDSHDTHDYPLLTRHFRECFDIAVAARRKHGRVLLHCLKAVNRSVAMAIALQLSLEGDCLHNAVRALVLRRQAPVLQNEDFIRQLVHFSGNMHVCRTTRTHARTPMHTQIHAVVPPVTSLFSSPASGTGQVRRRTYPSGPAE